MPEFLAAADACVATLMSIPLFGTTYPNKVFDYMAAGRPTLLAIDGVIKQVMQACEGGISTSPGHDAALAEAVLALSEDRNRGRFMGQRARVYVEQHFNRDQQASDFANLLGALSRQSHPSVYLRFGKRVLDLLLSSSALILLSPLIGLLALLVRLKLGSPVLFRQKRPGFKGIPFTLFKFRTMVDARDSDNRLLPDGERLTGLGRFLRSASLDELPELINVFKGEMSLVGPRPLLMEYLNRYTPEQARRHDVSPGITGWAQVNGRNSLAWEEKFALDQWYVEHQCFFLDMRILALTLWKMLRREGISQRGEATAAEFTGQGNN
jgi:lipopolysaccharide/colanic/teichoic acid biosynthesis glycosyltransferase